ncbi:hypothetical protein [Actinocorallia libanotica]|uniref:Flp family type IVb pilin n=1 Tax=Actinocorallia libanotica TaxID=46162 RepID=A0ABN1RUL4_9ACTN
MNPLIPLFVTLQTFAYDRLERFQEREDRGAGVVEYAALLVLAGALVAALFSAGLVQKLTTAVTTAVGQLFGTPT